MMTIDFLESIVNAFDTMGVIKKEWKILSIIERKDECFASGQPIADIVIYKDGTYRNIAFMNGTLGFPQKIEAQGESGFFIEDFERALDGYLRKPHEDNPISMVSFRIVTAFFHQKNRIVPYNKIRDR